MSGTREPNVVLIGLPGAGKTVVGRELAGAIGREFVDIDSEIERRERTTIDEIFRRSGEHTFRRMECDVTTELSARRDMVIATGGGWVLNRDAVALLRKSSRIIYLRVTPRTAARRLQGELPRRPLLRGAPLRNLERLYAERRELYEQADAVIDTEVLTTEEVTGAIRRLVDDSRKYCPRNLL